MLPSLSTTDVSLHDRHVSVPPHGGVEMPVHACQVPSLPLDSMSMPACAHTLSQRWYVAAKGHLFIFPVWPSMVTCSHLPFPCNPHIVDNACPHTCHTPAMYTCSCLLCPSTVTGAYLFACLPFPSNTIWQWEHACCRTGTLPVAWACQFMHANHTICNLGTPVPTPKLPNATTR